MDLVEQVIRVYDNYGFQTQIVVSEARNPIHVLDAALMGADVAALPAAVLEQLFRHPFSDELAGGEAVVKVSADRILYLSRVILKSLKESRNLEQKADDETARRAVVRELTDSYAELDTLEEKVESLAGQAQELCPRPSGSSSFRGRSRTSCESTALDAPCKYLL